MVLTLEGLPMMADQPGISQNSRWSMHLGSGDPYFLKDQCIYFKGTDLWFLVGLILIFFFFFFSIVIIIERDI